MKFLKWAGLFVALCGVLVARAPAGGQAVNASQQLVFAGLRSAGGQGQFNAVKTDSAGNLYLLLDERDGVRVLKTDSAGGAVLAQALLGAKGDVGVGMALDPAGNVYVTGTTTSAALVATNGAAFPARTDGSVNSFVAKFDGDLKPLFVTFTGGSRIAAAAVAASADAVFVTGNLYSATLPVTANGIQQTPSFGSVQNGFAEKFSADGGTLLYATYLTGASGDTTPAGIAVDGADNAYIVGATSASGFPTVAALVPTILGATSGFLLKLTPAGDAIAFSTFVPGDGLSSVALDSTGQGLLLSGSVALGQFPVDAVSGPLVAGLTYQVLVRVPLDGSTVTGATVVAPGGQSYVAAVPGGGAWVDGVTTAPGLLPGTPLSTVGNGFAVRVTAAGVVDQTARFGGGANQSLGFAGLPATVTAVAVDAAGEALIAGSVQPTASANLLGTETYDLPLRNGFTAALPSSVRDAEVAAGTCTGSLCAGSAAYLAKVDTRGAGPALALSVDDAPNVVIRNLGSGAATGVTVVGSGGAVSTTCGAVLAAGAECDALLPVGTTSVTVTAANGGAQTVAVPPFLAAANGFVFVPKELNFGVVTAPGGAGVRTITVTNLGAASQTFASANEGPVKGGSPFAEVGSDCTVAGSGKVLAAGGTCHISVGFTAGASAASDGVVLGNFLVGGREVALRAYSQAAGVSASATQIDFGTQFTGGIRLPRYLYLSNQTAGAVAHTPVTVGAGSPFRVTDGCGTAIAAASVCRIRVDYLAATAPSRDSATVALDGGLTVTLTGQTLPPRGVGGVTVNPNLVVTPGAITFANAVPVTGVGGTNQTVSITNTGAAPFALSLVLTGDFTQQSSCGAVLAGGQTCAVAITFAPSQPGARQGLLAVTAGAGTTPAYVTLGGTGLGILPVNNGSLDAGSVAVGEPGVQFYKISEPFSSLTVAATGPYTVALVEDTGFGHGQPAGAAYAATVTGTCRNCYLAVRFLPTAAGVQAGSVTLSSAAGGTPYTLALTGMGVAQTGLVITPGGQDFGSVAVRSSSGAVIFTVTNLAAGGGSVNLPGAGVSGDFTVGAGPVQGCGGNLEFGASCSLAVTFVPGVTGLRTGTLLVGGTAVGLTGFGTADPGVALDPTALTFRNVPGPAATQGSVTVTNTSGATETVGTPGVGTGAFRAAGGCGTLGPGASCAIAVTYQPGAATVEDTLAIPVTTVGAGGATSTATYNVALHGNYVASAAGLVIAPGESDFGPAAASSPGGVRVFSVANATGKALTLQVNLPRQFVLAGAPCGALAPGASCSFTLQFVPLTNGGITGSVFVEAKPSDGSATLSSIVYLQGFGVGQGVLAISGVPPPGNVLSFGQVNSGGNATQTVTLRNASGTVPLTMRRISSAPPFLSTTTCGATLPATQSCTVTVTYAPTNQVAAGTASPPSLNDTGSLVIESDAASSPDVVNLQGQAGAVGVASPANPVVLATYTLSQSSLTFGPTAVGNVSAPQTSTLANTGTLPIHVLGVVTTPDFTVANGCATVLPGASCTFAVTSTPQTAGTHVSALEIQSDSTTSLEFISLIAGGTPAPLTIAPTSLDFGSVNLNVTSSPQAVQVTNTSGAAVIFGAITASGDFLAGGTCPAPAGTLAAGASCTVQVAFTPTQTGNRTGVLSVATSATTLPLTVALRGTGIQSQLVVSPGSLAFGPIVAGASASLQVTLSNTGTAAITNLVLTTTGDYAVTIPCPAATLAPGATCTAQVTFAPTALGARPGTLTVRSSDPRSPVVVPLTGTGVQGGAFDLTVDGASSSSVTVRSGAPATYTLTATPTGGFAGTVALTCAAVVAAQYASCSITPSTLSLGGGAQTAVVTINTLTSIGGNARLETGPGKVVLALLLPGLFACWGNRRRLSRRIPVLLALLLTAGGLLATGCGSGPGNPNLRYTPRGTYQYQVTASSTSGVQVSRTVTLNLSVQ